MGRQDAGLELHDFDIFISYAQADRRRVWPLAERLRDEGLRIWIDKWELRGGDFLPEALDNGIQRSRHVLFCLSKASLSREWPALERVMTVVADPVNRRRKFIPVLMDDCEALLPGYLRPFVYLRAPAFGSGFRSQIMSRCGRLPASQIGPSRSDDETPRVLIVEDEPGTAAAMQDAVAKLGWQSLVDMDGRPVLAHAREFRPDVILLDAALPGMSGFEVCRQLRADPITASTWIVMVSGYHEEQDILRGYEVGIDEFLAKPLSMNVLRARLTSLVSRIAAQPQSGARQLIACGPVFVDMNSQAVSVSGTPISCDAAEHRILRTLVLSHGRAVSRSHLVRAAAEAGVSLTADRIDPLIESLRRKLSPYGHCLRSVPGVGFAIHAP
jgi:two-component system, OmpR family, alkaline phosphatase synthesis response regulator PhoP